MSDVEAPTLAAALAAVHRDWCPMSRDCTEPTCMTLHAINRAAELALSMAADLCDAEGLELTAPRIRALLPAQGGGR